MAKLFLGTVTKNYHEKTKKDVFISGEKIYLTKHSWDCSWYWGFGYIGNHNLHTHFDSCLLTEVYSVDDIFTESPITESEWWIIRDLFIQAYALRKCAEVYHYGGHQTTKKGVTDVIQNKELENKINSDLEIVLNTVWDFIEKALNKTMLSKKEVITRFEIEEKDKIKYTGDNLSYINKLTKSWDYYIEKLYKNEKCITRKQLVTWVNPYKNIVIPSISSEDN